MSSASELARHKAVNSKPTFVAANAYRQEATEPQLRAQYRESAAETSLGELV
jgi:hypothetical protein